MTEQPTPNAILRTWEAAANADRRADTIEGSMPALEADIAKCEAYLRELRNQHANLGREILAGRKDAELFREEVGLWCTANGAPKIGRAHV